MSPTLLELVMAVLLLLAAWQIGVAIAPRIFAAIVAFWRGGSKPFAPPDEFTPGRSEKNITPPSPPPIPPTGNPRKNHGSPR